MIRQSDGLEAAAWPPGVRSPRIDSGGSAVGGPPNVGSTGVGGSADRRAGFRHVVVDPRAFTPPEVGAYEPAALRLRATNRPT